MLIFDATFAKSVLKMSVVTSEYFGEEINIVHIIIKAVLAKYKAIFALNLQICVKYGKGNYNEKKLKIFPY